MPTIERNLLDEARRRHSDGRAETFYDAKLRGFGVRFHASGARSWILDYRASDGRKRRLVLGHPETLGLAGAKEAARKHLARIELGADPQAEREAQRRAETAAQMFDTYVKEHCEIDLKPSTATLYAAYLENWIRPVWGARKANSITREDVKRLRRYVAEYTASSSSKQMNGRGRSKAGGRGAANRVVIFVSGAFRWASEHGVLPEGHPNPARGIKPFDGNKRERFLTAAEFARIGEALRLAESEGIPWSPRPGANAKHAPSEQNRRVKFDKWAVAAVRLLVFTGCRLREILNLKWSEVDLERGVLRLGDSKTGAKVVMLSAPAIEILANLERVGPFVIASTDAKPRPDLKRIWARITAHADLDSHGTEGDQDYRVGLRIHDLRHSFASVGVIGGLNLPVIGKLLGHADVSTTQRYAHLSEDPVRRGADAIARTIEAQLAGKSGVVVPIRGGGE